MSYKQPMEAGCYIGAEWVSTPATFEVTNPATGDVVGGGVFGGLSFYCVVMALDGLVAPSVTGHLQAAYRPRDIEKQRKALIN